MTILFLTPSFVSAQTAFGTKASTVSGSVASSGGSLPPFWTITIALVVVGALLKWGFPALLKRFSTTPTASGGELKVETSLPIEGGKLMILQVEGKRLLVGVTTHSMSCLANLEDPEPTPPLFAEIVKAETEHLNPAVFALANETDPDAARAAAALNRLERLLR